MSLSNIGRKHWYRILIGKTAIFLAWAFCVAAVMLLVVIVFAHLATHYHERVPVNENLSEKWLLSNANVVDLNGSQELLLAQDLLIENGIIKDIVPHGSKFFKVRKIDTSGKFVTAGLIDSHVHIEDSAYLGLALSYGVTTVRGMRGNTAQLKWREQINNGEWLGSRFYVASPIIDGQAGDPFHVTVTSADQAEELVRRYADGGYDLIKVYGSIKGEVFDEIISTARKLDIPVAKHGPYPANERSFTSLQSLQSVEHIEDIYSKLLNYSVENKAALSVALEKLATADVPVVTTLAVFDELALISRDKYKYIEELPLHFFNDAHLQLTTMFGVERWLNASEELAARNVQDLAHLKHILRELKTRNIPIVLGSDSGALVGVTGFSTHKELQLLIDSGFSNKEALLAGTINAAKMLGVGDKLGEVKKGFVADFIITADNPLKNIKTLQSPDAVSYRGLYLDRRKLDELKVNAEKTLPVWLTYPMLFWQMIKENYVSST
ncbi:amidohydrolase family protein [Alteromonas gracilis]|uniref:amidohydrolase family protein n=1 Tax=Alteromonas gracilis TaxID=1479524 RepID=UPI0030D1665B